MTELRDFAFRIGIFAAATLLIRLQPALLRSRTALVAIAVVNAVAIYGKFAPGFFIVQAIVLIALSLLPLHRAPLWVGAIALVLTAQALGRRLGLEGSSPLFYLDMWMTLRLASFFWEVGVGKIERPPFVDYFLWSALPVIGHSPLIRYSEFSADLPPVLAGEKRHAKLPFSRLALGALQLVSAGFVNYTSLHFDQLGLHSPFAQKILLGFFVLPWQFFLIYAGYFKVIEWLAPHWGFSVKPSYEFPFFRRNISEFWAHWNMTATTFFRDSLFYFRWGLKRPNVYLNTMILFALMGLWHGANSYWLGFGVLHGIGFCLFIAYKSAKGPAFPRPIAIALTYVYVCLAWLVPSKLGQWF